MTLTLVDPQGGRTIPTLNLRKLPDRLPERLFSLWRDRFVEEASRYRPKLRRLAIRARAKPRTPYAGYNYVLRAYRVGRTWESAGIAEEMIFGATYLTDPSALRNEIDMFTAALRLGLGPAEKWSVVDDGVRACKYAWQQQWGSERFELELLRYGIREVADRWVAPSNTVQEGER